MTELGSLMVVSILILCKKCICLFFILTIIVIISIHLILIFNQVGYILYCAFRSRALRAGGGGGGGVTNLFLKRDQDQVKKAK